MGASGSMGLRGFFAAALLLVACGGHAPLDHTYRMPADASSGEMGAATRAAAEWSTCYGVSLEVAPDGEIPVQRVHVIRDGQHFEGMTNCNPDCVVEYVDGTGLPLHDILLHEFGHTLGLNHSCSGVMAGPPCVTGQSVGAHVTRADCDAIVLFGR